ncbi:unnamed protein product [Chilo suppressalis]|uniref:FP protein C-terminal domain-containing protein n=1 Tax=Chilo suppressalis TaxID=168631 RepID=A0ABN8BCP4_CHISP|nr:unnamed protein product [Chilo suppressalis]
MPNLARSPPLNKSHSMSDSDVAKSSNPLLDESKIMQRDSKRRRLSDTVTEIEHDNIRTIIREELRDMLCSLQTQQNTRLDAFEQHFSEIKGQEGDIKKINALLLEIKNTNISIEGTMSFLASQNDDLKNKLEHLEMQNKKNIEHITILEEKLEDIQREKRKANIEIKNVPKMTEETRETLVEMVTNLSKTLGCKLDEGHITDIYRLKAKRGTNGNSPIIVETSSSMLKTELLTLCKAFNRKTKPKLCAKHLGLKKSEDTPIFVSEHLTIKGTRLFFLARELAKTNTFKYCWTAYGRVYLREHDTSPIITVKSESQINGLMQKKKI